jgi:hypothetical protein
MKKKNIKSNTIENLSLIEIIHMKLILTKEFDELRLNCFEILKLLGPSIHLEIK